ncbi:hypothetical protein Tfer_2023 [Thermincola ferriacetica]|uniref:VWFA domain-containing protein n=1 Tax=Thermincola ferriacetica TaxID=281456 RepID=A0A0L6W1G5_9FIRM|nr:hypothetical protein [Thermincola ferriacetica]KNZ69385.1 hypothetical protein Tfer_2023 [Thermincola ferriacetica]
MGGIKNLELTGFADRYLKALSLEERQDFLDFISGLPETVAGLVIDTGLQFHKSSAVNGTWFWRTVSVLAGRLEIHELKQWLEEGTRICRGQWDCALSYLKESPAVLEQVGNQVFLNWLQIGRFLARFSNHDTNWFFKYSGSILEKLEKSDQYLLTSWILKIVQYSWTAAIACLKSWPEIERYGKGLDKAGLLEQGYKLAIEKPDDADVFFKALPNFLQVAGSKYIYQWLEAAYEVTNAKRGTLSAFFKASPEVAVFTGKDVFTGKIKHWALLGNRLAAIDNELAMEFFDKTPQVLKKMEWNELEEWVRLIERVSRDYSTEGAAEFIKSTPELLQQLDIKEAAQWVEYGLKSELGGKKLAYFTMKSQESRDVISGLRSGLHIESVKKVLHIYCEGLTGETVIIRNSSDLPTRIHSDDQLFGSLDTRRIYLPDLVKVFENERDNLRFYRVMMMHLVAHRKFGTMELSKAEFKELALDSKLGMLFEYIEDNRVDYLAMQKFPGLERDMRLLVKASVREIQKRTPNLYAFLIHYLWSDKADVPEKIKTEYLRFWDNVLKNGASSRESLNLARRIINILSWQEIFEKEFSPHYDGEYKNLAYRGKLKFDLIYTSMKADEEIDGSPAEGSKVNNGIGQEEDIELDKKFFSPQNQALNLSDEFYLWLKKLLHRFREDEENPYRMVVYYDEWDRTLNDYKKDWCRVREILLKPSTAAFVDRTLEENYGMINTIKRYFGMLQPERFRRYNRQEEGEEVDIDAVIEAMVEIKADVSPGTGFYVRRDKRERDVAVGFLLDLSYSTDEVISENGKTILDVEMESVIVMAEALEVLGDKYAIYGFNSDLRDKINFYVVKDFEEPYTFEVKQRFGGLQSYGMTRLASAVRHAVFKMEKVQAAIKILIILSDGRPFDFDYHSQLTKDYEEFYAETDTRMCLREAKMKGINPFCITVDRKGQDYLEYIFGNVNYIIIDDINALPTKLTETYKNLTT